MKYLRHISVIAVMLAILIPSITGAASFFRGCDGVADDATCKEAKAAGTADEKRAAAGGRVGKIVNGILYLVGALGVIMIVYGGLRLLLSGGDAAAVTTAKSTILYAVVGLIVAVVAFAIVNFVLGVFK